MLTRHSIAVARLSTRLIASDPAPMVGTLVMPLILSMFLSPGSRAQLAQAGYGAANGSEQTVPGMAILFAFLSTQLIGMLFYREHAWGTWDRLRVSQANTLDIVAGKVAPLYVVQLTQSAFVFVFGWAVLGYRITGSILALAVILVAFTFALTSFGTMLVALFRTMDAVMVIGSLGGMVMAGLGGAFNPIASLPTWVQSVAIASPAYWALDALQRITLDGATLLDIGGHALALVGFGFAFAVVTGLRFRASDAKIGTT